MKGLEKSGVLLINLGSPQELSISAIARFLASFLTDKRVINLPKFLWYPVLYGIILPFRSRKLLRQYKKLWDISKTQESPLLYYTYQIAKNLQQTFDGLNKNNNQYIIAHAFCYANPSVYDALASIHEKYNVQELLVIPLYPQFSSTTTAAAFDQVVNFYRDKKYIPNFKFNRTFANNEIYINAICTTINNSWKINAKRGQVLVFSYHGLPKALIESGDSYYNECLETTKLVAIKLGLSSSEYVVGFQSKFGTNKWLEPATSNLLSDLVCEKKITEIDVICPGFVCDCLETLEEIATLNKKIFLENGGRYFNYIPCLNDGVEFNQVLLNMVQNL